MVVFVTAHHQFALDAFDVHALDYLLKPVCDARMAAALARAAAQESALSPSPYWKQLSVRSVGRIECVWVADLHWIEACGNYVQLHLAGRSMLHRVPVSRLLRHLDPARFVQVHRSAIVRLDQARRLAVEGDGSYRLTLHSGAQVVVSERHVDVLRAVMAQKQALARR